MNYQRIKAMQAHYGYNELQSMIDSGQAWKMEGSYGRMAMYALERGMCMLPKESHSDYYGNRVPSRDEVPSGSKGSYKNCVNFWQGVEDGSIYLEIENQ